MDLKLDDHMQAILVAVPILGLLLIGFFVSLRSGDVSLSSFRGVRLLLGNLSRVLIRVAGYVVCLLAVQYIVGFPIGLAW